MIRSTVISLLSIVIVSRSIAGAPADRIVAGIRAATTAAADFEEALARRCDPALSAILDEVTTRSPGIALARARAAAAAQVPVQARSLADPMLQIMTTSDVNGRWASSTDVLVMASQSVPARGKRRLMGEAAAAEADAASASVESARLDALAEARRWYYELAYLDEAEELRAIERDALRDFVSIARSRYETGGGLMADVMKTSTEVTRVEVDLVGFFGQRRSALASLNSLRDRPLDTPVTASGLPRVDAVSVDLASLREAAASRRPELREASALRAAADARSQLARLAAKPDLTLGGFYEAMDLGIADGDMNEAGFVIGVSLPVRRKRIAAGVEEAVQLRLASAEGSRLAGAAIERDIGDAMARLDTASRQARLQDDVLTIQAEESVRSLLSAYTSGTATALEVLDALRIAYEVRLLALRSRADYLQALSSLAAATASPTLGRAACDSAEDDVGERALGGSATRTESPGKPEETRTSSEIASEQPNRRSTLGR